MSESKLLQRLKKSEPDLRVRYANRLYHGKYAYRLDFYLPGAFTLYAYNAKITPKNIDLILYRRIQNEFLWESRSKGLNDANRQWAEDLFQRANRKNYLAVDDLYDIYVQTKNFKGEIRHRVENNHMNFYFTTATGALNFFRSLPKRVQDGILGVQITRQKVVLNKSEPVKISNLFKKYKYQVYLRAVKWNQNEAGSFLHHAKNNKCRLPKATIEDLEMRTKMSYDYVLWGYDYFYIKDDKTLWFFRLMFGAKMGKVYRLISKK